MRAYERSLTAEQPNPAISGFRATSMGARSSEFRALRNYNLLNFLPALLLVEPMIGSLALLVDLRP